MREVKFKCVRFTIQNTLIGNSKDSQSLCHFYVSHRFLVA
ncbi:MAG: hypothetical protein NVSMB56_17060 [Pyrinomonadaceae bacterium]